MTLLAVSVVAVLLLCLAYLMVIRALRADQMWMKTVGFVLAGLLVLTVFAAPLYMMAGRGMGGFGNRGFAMGRQMDDRGQERFGNSFGRQDRQYPNDQSDGRQWQGRQMPWGRQQPNSGQCPNFGQPPNPGQNSNPGLPNQKIPNPGTPNQAIPKNP